MAFNSLQFVIFFIFFYTLYLCLKHKWQNWLLFLSSCIFYCLWDWRFLILLFISITTDYFCGLNIGKTENEKKKRLFLIISIVVNLSILGFFKYFNFFSENFAKLLSCFGVSSHPIVLRLILPLGISFYTFKTLGYTIDVYTGKTEPVKSYFNYAIFVSFFTLLAAGPIVRAKDFMPQISNPREISEMKIFAGIDLILWGLLKKVVVADRLALYVNVVYDNVYSHSGITFLLATFLFAFQVYCDFSGYSDIARGLSKIMGFSVIVNFRSPYLAVNIIDFWRRWHISLSTWLQDYVFIPLAFKTRGWGDFGVALSVIITFVLCGFWHGSSWTFIIWGGMHGVCVILTQLAQRKFGLLEGNNYKKKTYIGVISIVSTFCLTSLFWIFFRANNVPEAFYIVKSIFTSPANIFLRADALTTVVYGLIGIAIVFLLECYFHRKGRDDFFISGSLVVRFCFYYFAIFCLLLLGVFGGEQFIYFKF